MRNVWAIYKKEMKSCFDTPVAYIVLTVFLLISGFVFSIFPPTSIFTEGSQATVRFVLGAIPWIFLFFAPAVTMRAIAEEKKSGTIELLVTMPVRDYEIVLSKFLAALSLLVVALLFTVLYAIQVSLLGNLDAGATFTGYLGLMLVGASYLSMGFFASTISENQIVAFILGIAMVIAFFLLDWLASYMPGMVATVFNFLSPNYHFESISRGVIDSRDIIYYLSLITFMLTLSVRSLESRKW